MGSKQEHQLGCGGEMLAVNITRRLASTLDDSGHGEVIACAKAGWAVPDSTLQGYADQLLVVAHNRVAGVFTVRGWSRDADNQVVFDLVPTLEWQWLVGQRSPLRVDRVCKVGGVMLDVMAERRPPASIGGGAGWSLEVDPDGRAATVRGPAPGVVVTAANDNTVRLTIAEERDSSA